MTIILLTLAYVAIAALLLNLNLSSSWGAGIKFSGIVLVTLFYFVSYQGIRDLSGWPSNEELPEEFRVVWVNVEEPDKVTGTKGSIFLWLRQLDEQSQEPVGKPRAFEIAYDADTAEDVEEALAQIGKGKKLNGKRSRQALKPEEKQPDVESTDDDRTGEDGSEPSGINDFRIEFREIPPPELPPKPSL